MCKSTVFDQLAPNHALVTRMIPDGCYEYYNR